MVQCRAPRNDSLLIESRFLPLLLVFPTLLLTSRLFREFPLLTPRGRQLATTAPAAAAVFAASQQSALFVHSGEDVKAETLRRLFSGSSNPLTEEGAEGSTRDSGGSVGDVAATAQSLRPADLMLRKVTTFGGDEAAALTALLPREALRQLVMRTFHWGVCP